MQGKVNVLPPQITHCARVCLAPAPALQIRFNLNFFTHENRRRDCAPSRWMALSFTTKCNSRLQSYIRLPNRIPPYLFIDVSLIINVIITFIGWFNAFTISILISLQITIHPTNNDVDDSRVASTTTTQKPLRFYHRRRSLGHSLVRIISSLGDRSSTRLSQIQFKRENFSRNSAKSE